MKDFPKRIQTAQDIENCFGMVNVGTLAAADLLAALESIERRAFVHCPIFEFRDTARKKPVIRYCGEAQPGAAGNCEISSVKHEADAEESAGMDSGYAFTVLTLAASLAAEESVIKIPLPDPFAAMGMYSERVAEIKEALRNGDN